MGEEELEAISPRHIFNLSCVLTTQSIKGPKKFLPLRYISQDRHACRFLENGNNFQEFKSPQHLLDLFSSVYLSWKSGTVRKFANFTTCRRTASPDRPFRDFKASKSDDQQFQTTWSLSIDKFPGSKIVKKVGRAGFFSPTYSRSACQLAWCTFNSCWVLSVWCELPAKFTQKV